MISARLEQGMYNRGEGPVQTPYCPASLRPFFKRASFPSGRILPFLVLMLSAFIGYGTEARAHNFSDTSHTLLSSCEDIPGSFSVHAVADWASFNDGTTRTRFDVCIKGGNTNFNPYDEGSELEIGRLVNGQRVPYSGTWNPNGGFGINMYDSNWEGTADHSEAAFFEQSFGLECAADDPNVPDEDECPMNNDPEDNNNLVPRETLIYLEWNCGGTDEPACPSGFSNRVRVQAHNAAAQDGITRDDTLASINEGGPARGTVRISGTPQVGQTLTASLSGVSDPDGLGSDPGYTYEWIRLDSSNNNPSVGSGTTYMPTEDDVGYRLQVVVTFSDSQGNPEELESSSTSPVTAAPPGLVQGGIDVSRSSFTVDEGDEVTGATYTVQLTVMPEVDVTVTISGHSGTDLTVVPSRLTFKVDEYNQSQTIKVTAREDDDAANDEVTLTHRSATSLYVASPVDVQVTVTDNDTAGVTVSESSLDIDEGGGGSYTLVLDSQPTAPVQINLSGHDTNSDVTVRPETVRFTSSNWKRPQTIRISVREDGDSDNEPAQTIVHTVVGTGEYASVTADSVDLSFRDNDQPGLTLSRTSLSVPEGGRGTYTVKLNTQPSADVTVDITGATSDVGVSDNSLTFTTSDWNQAQAVTVTSLTDDNLDQDDLVVTLTNTTSSSDSDYNSLPTRDVTVTVVDNDTVGLVVSKSSVQLNEGEEDTYTVALGTVPSQDVVVNITGATENASIDLTSLTFTPSDWNQPRTVTVTAGDDDVDQEYDPVTLVHAATSTDPDYEGSSRTVRVIIVDSETRGVVVSTEKLTVSEELDGTYTLMLTSEPTEPVVIRVMSSNSEVMASPDSLTFTASDWHMEQTVTVMATAMDYAELTHQVTSTGDYASATAASVQVNEQQQQEQEQEQEQEQVSSLLNEVNDELLPRITQAMMSSALSAVSRRMDMANPNVDSEGPHTFGGQTSLEQALASLATATKGTTSLGLRHALGGKEFVLPFNAAEGETKSAVEVWGRGDYRNLGGGDDRPTRWDGDLASIHVGVDWEVRPGLLAGLMVSWQDGKFDYQNQGDPREGTYDSQLTSVHPYVSWMSFENALQAWATIGYGRGEIEINDGNGKHSSDTRLKTAAVGVSAVLASEHNQIMFGTSTLRIKAEGNVTEIKADGGDEINPLTADIERIRVVLEGRHVCERGPGEWLTPWVEVGARHDSGDGLTGTGMEIGTGVRYSNAAKGLTVEGEARYLINHSDDYDEWGFHGEVRIDPGADGRGLSFSLAPSLGQSQRGVASLWARDGPDALPMDGRRSVDGRLDAQIEYGLPAAGGRGLLTPYAHISLAGEDGDFRIGSRLEVGPTFSLNVEGGRFGEVEGSSDVGVGFFVQMLF